MAKYLTDKQLVEAAHGTLWVCCEHLHREKCSIY